MSYSRNDDRRHRNTIKELKAMVNQLRKENRLLRQELDNIMKPERPRKEHVEESPKMMTKEDWRRDFVKRFRPGLEKRLEEICGGEGKDES